MLQSKARLLFGLAGLSLVATQASAATTFIDLNAGITANARVTDNRINQQTTNTSNDRVSSVSELPLDPIIFNAAASITKSDTNGLMGTAQHTEQATLTFAGANSATLTRTGSASLQTFAPYANTTVFSTSSFDLLNYTFSIDAAAPFTFIYSQDDFNPGSSATTVASLHQIDGMMTVATLIDQFLGLQSSGTITVDLAPGTYNFALRSGAANLAAFSQGIGSASVSHADSYSFAIGENPVNAVPEASSWALMILGVGMMGMVARRRGYGHPLPAPLRVA